jgi:hypothetical protein
MVTMAIVRRWFLAFALAAPVVLGGAPYPLSVHRVATAAEKMVVFNAQTHKYHDPSCTWARRCTRHCKTLPLSEAIRRGGVPCKVCGG